MKKLMLAATIVCAAVMAQAAATDWKFSATNIIGTDNTAGTSLASGTAILYAADTGKDNWFKVAEGSVSAGSIKASSNGFQSDLLVAGKNYDFYFTIDDATSGKKFTSNTKSNLACYDPGKTQSIIFGTQAGNTWTAAAPEPTSGLLLLLGVAGMALRRRRA